MGIKQILKNTLLASSLLFSPFAAAPASEPPAQTVRLQESRLEKIADELKEQENAEERFSLRAADLEFFGEERFKLQYGEGMTERIMTLMFEIPGRYKRVQFLGPKRFGKVKVEYKELDWRQFATHHFDIFAYDKGFIDDFISLSEMSYDKLSLDFKNTFSDLRVQSYFYMTRRDYEQTRFFPWLVPEGLGGFTFTREQEKFRVVSLFEADFSDWWHVWNHEYAHWHDMQLQEHMKKTDGIAHELPLWMIEGTAEHFSKPWDAEDETVIRDAYFHDFFFPTSEMWMIDGTWLMYKEGHFVMNMIGDNFGNEAVLNFRNNMKLGSFESNLEATIGMGTQKLDEMIGRELDARYLTMRDIKGIEDLSASMGDGKIFAADGNFFLSGMFKDGRARIYLNHFDEFNNIVDEEIASDDRPENESLHYFKAGADIKEGTIAFAIRNNNADELRLNSYSYDKGFSLGKEEAFRFDGIEVIRSPAIIDKERIAFIGHKEGFAQVFVFNRKSRKLEQMTKGKTGYNSLDFSKETNALIVSREDGKYGNYTDAIYSLSLETKAMEKIIDADFNARAPKVSPDGKTLAFVGDEGNVFNLYVYDFGTKQHARLGNAKVAALSPNWVDNETILFNSVKMFRQTMHKMKFEGFSKAFAQNLESKLDGSEAEFNGIASKGGKLFIKADGETLNVDAAAVEDKAMYLIASAKNSRKLFRYDGKLEEINARKKNSAEDLKDANIDAIVNALNESRTILKTAVSDDKRYVAFAFNNRLSLLEELSDDEKKEFPLSFAVYDNLEHSMIWLPRIKVLKEQSWLQKVFGGAQKASTSALLGMDFVGDNLLLEFGDWIAYDMNDRKLYKAFSEKGVKRSEGDVTELAGKMFAGRSQIELRLAAVSKDKRYIAGIGENSDDDDYDSLFVYDVKEKKIKEIGKFSEDAITNLKFAEDGRVLFWNGRANKTPGYRYYAPGAADSVRIDFNADGRLEDVDAHDETVMLKVLVGKGKTQKEEFYAGIEKFGRLYAEKALNEKSRFNIDLDSDTGIIATDSEYGKEMFIYLDEPVKFSGVKKAGIMGKELLLQDNDAKLHRISLDEFADRMIADSIMIVTEGGKAVYGTYKDGRYDYFLLDIASGKEVEIASSDKMLLPSINDGIVQFSEQKKGDKGEAKPKKAAYEEKRIEKQFSRLPFDRMNFHLIGGISPSTAFIDTYFTSQDSLWEKMLIVDFTGNFKTLDFGTLGYVDNSTNSLVQAFIRHYGDSIITGTSYSHTWPMTRYVSLDATVAYEYQKMNYFDFRGNNHVLKAGFGIGYDTTIWSINGPVDGFRAYVNFETGLSMNRTGISNIDMNVGFRQYYSPHHLITFAYRAEAGQSEGLAPTLFLLGGNQTLRGIPFDGAIGNNYFLVGGEARSPLFKVVGAIVDEPLTMLSGLFMNYDVELGIYADAGAAWYANQHKTGSPVHSGIENFSSPDPKWDIGWSLNFTTPFGIRLRFNQAIWGNVSDWNFWIGYNW